VGRQRDDADALVTVFALCLSLSHRAAHESCKDRITVVLGSSSCDLSGRHFQRVLMLGQSRSVLILVACLMASSNLLWAAPITIQASGEIASKWDFDGCPPGEEGGFYCEPRLEQVYVGMPWQLTVTYETDSPRFSAGVGLDAFVYYPAIIGAEFQLGDFAYTNSGDGLQDLMTVNYFLPGGFGVPGSGLVQFHFNSSWVSVGGGPDFSQGLLVAGWNDLNAVDGSLPSSLDVSDDPTWAFLMWQLLPDTIGVPIFFSEDFRPELVQEPAPVPEPSTWLLLGAGVSALAARRRMTARR
jgi:hypothetical protein